jgi:YD repeat-containing protein
LQRDPAPEFMVTDIVNNVSKSPGMTFANSNNGQKWPVGFYRIDVFEFNGYGYDEITVTFNNYFKDISYQFYDDRGALIESLSPNGYKQWKDTVAFADVDKTTYQYNHQGWLLSMTEPDAGKTSYKYRKDGSIRFSQNAEQYRNDNATPRVVGTGKFSYTNYDELGRPVESGEYTGTQTFSSTASQVEFGSQVDYVDRKDWVKTFYDIPDPDFTLAGYTQDYVRGAVSHSQNANIHTWYSYDEFGRVTWMAQKPTVLPRMFVVTYAYDFLGSVLTVSNLSYDLSGTLQDQFYHHYEYDKDKRLNKAFTSVTTNGTQQLRAQYEYYLHGPLKRIVLGNNLQGIDFVYNINGWLKQINHPDQLQDPGQDGEGNGVKKDVFGMVLEYYDSELTQAPSLGAIHNLKQRHHLPFETEAYAINQPLIRFASPAALTENTGISFKDYGAQNPKYKAMIQGSNDN